VEIRDNGSLIEDTYYHRNSLALLDGAVSSDRLAESRASFRGEFEVLTDDGFELLSPLNSYEIVPSIGIELMEAIVWVPQGELFSVDIRHLSGAGRQKISVNSVDRSSRYRENPWKTVYSIEDEPTYGDAVRRILTDRANGWTPLVVGDLGTDTVPKTLAYSADEDPWAIVWKLGQSAGGEVFHDKDGVVVMRLVPAIDQVAPVLELLGSQYSIVDGEVGRELRRSEIYNGVICRGEAPWLLFPITGEVWDEDPLSPTYRYGPFGERPKIIGDAFVTSDAQCLTAAQAEFNRVAGIRQTVQLQTLQDPSVSVGDVVRIISGDLLEGLYFIDQASTTLSGGIMTMTLRSKL
jgi:hypothetical protein